MPRAEDTAGEEENDDKEENQEQKHHLIAKTLGHGHRLSTTVVVGWDGVHQAWQMRFAQMSPRHIV